MRLLVDTHALLWFELDDARLGVKAKELMSSGENELLLSTASLWEVALKVGLGKLTLFEPYHSFMDHVITEYELVLLPIRLNHTAVLIELPFHHRDPFDRLLIAQAISEEIPLLSGDSVFDAYGVARLW